MPTLILTPRRTEDAQAALAGGWPPWLGRCGAEKPPGEYPTNCGQLPIQFCIWNRFLDQRWPSSSAFAWRNRQWTGLPTLPEENTASGGCTSQHLARPAPRTEPCIRQARRTKEFPGARVYTGLELPADCKDAAPVLVAEVGDVGKGVPLLCTGPPAALPFDLPARGATPTEAQLRQEPTRKMRGPPSTLLETVLADPCVVLSRTAVLDIGVIADRGWAVVEQNAAWGSGIYGCDPEQVLEVLRFAVVQA